jgi:hypothetical protein
MRVPSRKRNNPPQPSRSLNRRLNLYALAAGAAGASIFATQQPAQAEVVYTPAHLTLTNGQLLIDLNHDGDVDFIVSNKSARGSCSCLTRKLRVTGAFVGSSQNSVEGIGLNASALKAGAVVGPRDLFLAAPMQMATALNEISNSFYYVYGPFANKRNRFLGLRFVLHGENHYGWAAFSVVKASFRGETPVIGATLSGYAYETVPDHPLIAGVIKSSSDAMATRSGVETAIASQPATLGLLALGYPGLSAWRREESLPTAQ